MYCREVSNIVLARSRSIYRCRQLEKVYTFFKFAWGRPSLRIMRTIVSCPFNTVMRASCLSLFNNFLVICKRVQALPFPFYKCGRSTRVNPDNKLGYPAHVCISVLDQLQAKSYESTVPSWAIVGTGEYVYSGSSSLTYEGKRRSDRLP